MMMKKRIVVLALVICGSLVGGALAGKKGTKLMEDEEMEAAAKKYVVAKKLIKGAVAMNEAALPQPLDESPYGFYVARQDVRGGAKDGGVERVYLAVDKSTGKVHHKDRRVFEAWVKALGYPQQTGKLRPDDIIGTWLGVVEGQPHGVATVASGNAPDNLKPLVSKAETRTAPDGSVVTVGWTEENRGFTLMRHTVTIHPDGKVTGESVDGKTLVK